MDTRIHSITTVDCGTGASTCFATQLDAGGQLCQDLRCACCRCAICGVRDPIWCSFCGYPERVPLILHSADKKAREGFALRNAA